MNLKQPDNINIDDIFDQYNNINHENNEELIDFVEANFETFINYKSEEIVEIEDIATILNDYSGALGLCNRWTETINRRERILNFIAQLKGKSFKYDDHIYDIELNCALAIINKGNDYKKAIEILEDLNTQFPKDEDILLILRKAKHSAREKTYKILLILSLTIVFATLILRLLMDMKEIKIASNLAWILLIGTFLTQHIDNYKSNKMPSS